jgi:predicted RNase H-like nuclease
MPRVLGVDGCRAGWLGSWKSAPGFPEARIWPTLEELLAETGAVVVAIDIPIGLPERGDRRCDVDARTRLGGGRSSSVFSAPQRSIVAASSFEEANRLRRAAEGKGVSRQAFGIFAKVHEVDRLLQQQPDVRGRLWEVHPEVSFAELAGGPIVPKKRSREGKRIRIEALQKFFDDDAFARVRESIPRREAGDDDILDALACLWTAERIDLGVAVSIPTLVPLDPLGIPMRIVY